MLHRFRDSSAYRRVVGLLKSVALYGMHYDVLQNGVSPRNFNPIVVRSFIVSGAPEFIGAPKRIRMSEPEIVVFYVTRVIVDNSGELCVVGKAGSAPPLPSLRAHSKDSRQLLDTSYRSFQ